MEIIGQIDYEAMKKEEQPRANEIAETVFNPVRMEEIVNKYGSKDEHGNNKLTVEELNEIY